jgi:hypothetical protein
MRELKEIDKELLELDHIITTIDSNISALRMKLDETILYENPCSQKEDEEKPIILRSGLGKKLHDYNLRLQRCNDIILNIIKRLALNQDHRQESKDG